MITKIRTTDTTKKLALIRALHGVGYKPWLEGYENDVWIVCFEADKQEDYDDKT